MKETGEQVLVFISIDNSLKKIQGAGPFGYFPS
jgi:hypothetical protein